MNTQIIIDLVLAIFASSGLWTLVLYLIQKRDKKKDNTTKLILGLGHEKIIELCKEYIARQSITESEYSDLMKYLYDPYKELGGNGTAEKAVEEVKKLPSEIERSVKNANE